MDLQTYFRDLRATEARLTREHPDSVVHVTSLFHRERNSTPGSTLSAVPRNAARVITDGTHREATPEEIAGFIAHQESELRRNTAAEQKSKRQYFVIVDGQQTPDQAAAATAESRARSGRAPAPAKD